LALENYKNIFLRRYVKCLDLGGKTSNNCHLYGG